MGPTMPIAKNKRVVDHRTNNTNTLLKYSGMMTGYMNIGVTAQIKVDSSTGIRYEVWFQGAKISSHIGIFYKFSNPHQTIIYNFATHQSQVSQGGGAIDNHPVSVVGMDSVNHYFCTHLQQAKNHETQDFWMSTSVPGFAQVVGALNGIDPNLQMMVIVQSIFKWGGLVRLRWVAVNPQQGNTTFTLNLIEAQTGIPFRLGEFDVPK
jgi:hypothetical protein